MKKNPITPAMSIWSNNEPEPGSIYAKAGAAALNRDMPIMSFNDKDFEFIGFQL